ncbi:MAG: replication protein RepA [Alphaproteobacteria bacterium]|jgi:hypothetical protein
MRQDDDASFKEIPVLSKQLKNKIEKIDQYLARSIDEEPQLLFLSKIFIMANLPHKKLEPGQIWIKRNGHFTLHLSGGERVVDDAIVNLGIPYGSYARLLLIWITTQAITQKSRVIKLKESLSKFMKELGIQPTGGVNGTIGGIKEQLIRLCSCKITIESDDYEHEMLGTQFFLIEDKNVKWMQSKEKAALFARESEIVLSEKFYDYITNKSVPFDFRVISAIKQSSLTLDIYLWMTYRTFALKKPIFVSWPQLHDQMGSQYANVNNFRDKFLKSLKEIQLIYPDLKTEREKGGLILYPSIPHIKAAA